MKAEYQLRDLRWENCVKSFNNPMTKCFEVNTRGYIDWSKGIKVVLDGDKWVAEKILILGDEDEN